MKKGLGWLMVVMSMVWGGNVVIASQAASKPISYTLGAVLVPVIFGLAGLFFAGVTKKLK